MKYFKIQTFTTITIALIISVWHCSCKKDDQHADYSINLVISNFKAESIRIVFTDTLESAVYYDKVFVDDDPEDPTNVVEDSFTVPNGIPKLLYKIRLEGSPTSLATVNFKHRGGGGSQGIGGIVTNDPDDKRYWVKGYLPISANL